jgi:hypothetical protein
MSLDAAAYPAIVNLANAIGVPPNWFLAIFALESGLSPNPAGNQSYAGISQLSVAQLQAAPYGIDPATYRSWPASQQITQVVSPWYQRAVAAAKLAAPPDSVGALYAFNLAPGIVAAQGDDESVVLYSSPSAAYTSNKPLDFDGNGAITIGDLTNFLQQRIMTRAPYTTALPLLNNVTPGNPLSPTGPLTAPKVLLYGSALFIAAAAAYAYLR